MDVLLAVPEAFDGAAGIIQKLSFEVLEVEVFVMVFLDFLHAIDEVETN